jgi:hypothetical protein
MCDAWSPHPPIGSAKNELNETANNYQTMREDRTGLPAQRRRV